jgi:hypothetical protein
MTAMRDPNLISSNSIAGSARSVLVPRKITENMCKRLEMLALRGF